MSGLVLDEVWEGSVQEYGAINITGLRNLDIFFKNIYGSGRL